MAPRTKASAAPKLPPLPPGLTPFLRWAGGKASHARKHRDKLPSPIGATGYRDPFLGGGAMFFMVYRDIRPAVLSDLNHRLINAYIVVRDKVEELITTLESYPYDEDFYYATRDKLNESPYSPPLQRAAWMIYLNRTCVNGLYRENLRGDFNVGFGRTANGEPPLICDADNLRACSIALQGVELRCGDFEPVLAEAREGERVFLDPPYLPESKTANFVGYTSKGFTHRPATPQVALFGASALPEPESDQDRLVRMLRHLEAVGAHWALTNADTALSRQLYQGFDIDTVQIQRSISLMGKTGDDGEREGKREAVGEIIVHGARHGRAA